MSNASRFWSQTFERFPTSTRMRRVRLRCAAGHGFVDEIPVSVDVSLDVALLDLLDGDGCHRLFCPTCGKRCPLAEPLLVHDPGHRRLGVFIPLPLAHRELTLHAEVLTGLAAADPDSVPELSAPPRVLLGRDDLDRWLDEKREPITQRPTAAPGPSSPPEEEQPPAEGQAIHAAFADLADEDDGRSASVIPPETEGDEADDDWLPASALGPPSVPPRDEPDDGGQGGPPAV